MKKEIISVLLCVVLMLGAVPMLGVPAQAATYRITYNKNTTNTVENMPTSTTVTGGDIAYIAEETPTRFRYTFLGWSPNSSATDPVLLPGDEIDLTSNLTLYAVWSYYTEFGLSTGYELDLTGESGYMAEIEFSGQQKWYRVRPTQSTSYTFWSTGGYDPNVTLYNSSGIELDSNDDNPYTMYDYSYRLNYSLESGLTYYIAVSGRTYGRGDHIWSWGYPGSTYRTVTYHTNIQGNDEVFMTQRQYNSVVADIPWQIPANSGKNFMGWSTDASAMGGDMYVPGNPLPEYKTMHLYAVWWDPYTIDSGISFCYPGSLEYGIKKEWFVFTPKSSGTYQFFVDEYTSNDFEDYLTFACLFDSSMNDVALSGYYDNDLKRWDFTAFLSKGKKYYIEISNFNESTIPLEKWYDEENDYEYYENINYVISIVKPSTLSYNANGGSGAPASQTGEYRYAISSVIPNRFGYNFCRWMDQSSLNDISYVGQELPDYFADWSNNIELNADTTLYAAWSQATLTSVNVALPENFLLKGQTYYYKFIPTTSGKYTIYSTGNSDTRAFLYDANGGELAYNDDSGENRNFLLTYSMNAGTTYYYGIQYYSSSATGTIDGKLVRTYSITYNANGGNGAPNNQDKYYGLPLTISETTPTKSFTITYNANGGSVSPTSKTVNCTFSKWNTNSSGTGTSYNAGANYTSDANVTLYAQWTNPTAGTLATPTRNGYMFDGWYTSSSGGSKITSSSTISANTTIYAHWTPNPSYTVSLNPNGGSVTPTSMPVPATLPTPSKSYTITYNAYGGSVSTSSKTVNCTFRNWNSNSSGSGSSYSAGANYNVSANTTLYAQWTNPTAGTLATPSRSGYTFDGWYTVSSGGNKITSSSTISANTTLYAHWTPIPANDYTITFDAQGGSVSPSSRTVTSGTTITLPTPSKSYTITFNANGGFVSTSSNTVFCSFRNWNTYSSGSGTSYNAGSNYTVYSNTTLYAQWTNPTAGSLPSASRGGYTFDGWYTSSSGGSRITSSSTISANTTLYAHWTYIPVMVVGCDVISAPNKTSYIYKENTDTSGTVLNIRYSDGSNKTVSDTSKMTFSGLTTSTVGTKTVSVTCEGVSASFNITVRYAWWQMLIRIFLLGFLWY